MTQRIPSSEQLRNDTYFRIIPKTFKFVSKDSAKYAKQYILYLEKGLQILGKSIPILTDQHFPSFQIPPNLNKFDFQIANEKNMNYTWTLYRIDDDNYEERVEEVKFSIKVQYESYIGKGDEKRINNFMLKKTFPAEQVEVEFLLLIQSTSDNLMKLTSSLLPDVSQEIMNSIMSSDHKKQNTSAGPPKLKDSVIQSTKNVSQEKQKIMPEATEKEPTPAEIPTDQKPEKQEEKKINEEVVEQKVVDQAEVVQEKLFAPPQAVEAIDATEEPPKQEESLAMQTESVMMNAENKQEKKEQKPTPTPTPKEEEKEIENTQEYVEVSPALENQHSSFQDDSKDEFDEKLKQQQKRENYKKLALMITILILIVGFIGSGIMPSPSIKKKKVKKTKNKVL